LAQALPHASTGSPYLKLHPDQTEGLNMIEAYTESSLTVNGQVLQSSILMPAQGAIRAWPIAHLDDLGPSHFEEIAALSPEVVILGSGPRLRFANPALLQALMQRRIGVETMDTRAACRTYNILVSEGRRVVAALLLGTPLPPN
jgi:uncharacterized protein